jgi:hypothetical protein
VRRVRTLGLCLVAAFAMSVVATSSALAEQNIEEYKKCPFHNPLVEVCTYGHTYAGEGGHYTVGGITVPITNSIVLQGGYYESEGKQVFVAPANGQAVVPVPETVPGEPLGNVTPAEQREFGWPETLEKKYENARIKGLFGPGTTTEIIESAGLPVLNNSNIIFEEGIGIQAPIKIIGKNKWLESIGGGKIGNCRIGSTEHPIVQHLTTGFSTSPLTSEMLRGSAGSLEILREGSEVTLNGSRFVDNTYPVPAAVGCGGGVYEGYLDPVVSRAFGLPAAAGSSNTELVGEFDLAVSSLVKKEL